MSVARQALVPTSFMVLSVLFAASATAQRTTFNPAITFTYFESGDVDSTGPQEASDTALRVGLELPLIRELRRGTLELSYRPGIEEFDTFAALDNTGHQFDLNLNLRPNPLSAFALSTRFEKSLERANAESQNDADLFLTRPTDRELATVDFDYQNRLSGRFRWQFTAGYRDASFSEIPGFESGDPVESRTELRSSIGISRSLSRTTSLGVEYGYGRAELDMSGDESIQSISLTARREFSPRSSLQLALGAFESTGSSALGPGGDPNDSRNGAQVRVGYRRELKKVEVGLVGSHGPSAGGARPGTSTNTVLGFSLQGAAGRRLDWRGSVRYAQRDAADSDEPQIESLVLGLESEVRLGRLISLRLGANYVSQDGEEERLELLSRGGVSLVWYPFAGTKMAGPGTSVGAGRGTQ